MGIFKDAEQALFPTYQATLVFRDKIMGGTPKDPKIIMAWLRTKTSITDEQELQAVMRRTLIELGADVPQNATYDQLVEASEKLANRQAVGFKRDERGLYVEARAIKAMLKESVSILFPYQKKDGKWGVTQKAARAYLAERVFVDPDKVYLDVSEPSGVDLFIGHTTGPKGPQSNLTLYEYVHRPTITFDVKVAEDGVDVKKWPTIWAHAQENGLGALRSQGFGRFDIEGFKRIRGGVSVPKAFEGALEAAVA